MGKITAGSQKSGMLHSLFAAAAFGRRRLEMASACALAINKGRFVYTSRLLRPAGRNKRIFTEGAVKENGEFSHREVVYGWDLSREKVVQKHPQVFLNHKLKIIFPLKMARAQRRPFKSSYTKRGCRTIRAAAPCKALWETITSR